MPNKSSHYYTANKNTNWHIGRISFQPFARHDEPDSETGKKTHDQNTEGNRCQREASIRRHDSNKQPQRGKHKTDRCGCKECNAHSPFDGVIHFRSASRYHRCPTALPAREFSGMAALPEIFAPKRQRRNGTNSHRHKNNGRLGNGLHCGPYRNRVRWQVLVVHGTSLGLRRTRLNPGIWPNCNSANLRTAVDITH